MLNKFSVLMMLLLGAGSLIGISSIYQPANVETQPQPAQPQGNPQLSTGKTITQQRAETLAQATADKQLLDRLFPQIIKRIDGKILAQKIDAATLIQKIDARTLAAKVLPYLDVNIVTVERPGPTHKVDVTGIIGKTVVASASCPPQESLVGGGLALLNVDVLHSSHQNPRPDVPNTWSVIASFDRDGQVTTSAECLKAELALKEVQQPEQLPPG
jgi:hypothetical protein